ncbi:TonB-dependent receptor [Sphingobium quisquiliarum]|uniref:TonB-dependent receptor n=1 Tax=Sphingobium quisquiliarum TaxID=538379 RepID=UPI00041F4C19|nr:TonB-dependent receptor [Sphingobium quisquiliarum]
MRTTKMLGVSIIALTISTPVWGQEHASGNDQNAPVAGVSGANGSSASSGQIEDIVVTAQRRSENLQRVPVSVTAVTAEAVQALGVRGTQDLAVITPGLKVTISVGNATPFLRGVGAQSVGAGQESSIATYVDGVYIASQAGSVFALNNIERIEVLKGPQGTLFGRNATGGLVQVITRDPSQTPSVEASVGYDNFETLETKLYATGGIAPNLAVDFAGYYSHQGQGWGKNIPTGEDVNRTPLDLSLRTKWLYEPGSDTRITLSADYSKTHSSKAVAVRAIEGAVTATGYRFNGGFWDTASDYFSDSRVEAWGGSLKVEQGLGDIRLLSISAYRNTKGFQSFDQDASPTPGLVIALQPREKQFSQELQLLSDESSPIKWIFGLYYFRNDARTNPNATVYPFLSHQPGPIDQITNARQVTTSLAAYAQATVPLGEDTNLTGGIRYTRDRRRLSGYNQTILTFADVALPRTVAEPQKVTDSQPSWRLSLDHHFTPDLMVYASYNRGFKSGTFNLNALTAPPLEPEKIDAFEGGLKVDALDRHLRLNIAGFYYDYSNIQLTRTLSGTLQILNAASAKIYGAEAELTAIPFQGLTLRGSLSLMHSRYTSFPDAVLITPNRDPVTGQLTGGNSISSFDASGRHTINAPDYTFNLGATYETDLGGGTLSLSGNYYRSARWFPEADNRIFQPGYELVSAEIGYSFPGDHYKVRLWGRNLTNSKVYGLLSEQELVDGGSVLNRAPMA